MTDSVEAKEGHRTVWLERALPASRRDPGIDWVVVCMRPVVISTADKFNLRPTGAAPTPRAP